MLRISKLTNYVFDQCIYLKELSFAETISDLNNYQILDDITTNPYAFKQNREISMRNWILVTNGNKRIDIHGDNWLSQFNCNWHVINIYGNTEQELLLQTFGNCLFL